MPRWRVARRWQIQADILGHFSGATNPPLNAGNWRKAANTGILIAQGRNFAVLTLDHADHSREGGARKTKQEQRRFSSAIITLRKRRYQPMKQANSHVTLLVGPQTRLARALNNTVRTRRAAIAAEGVTAIPNRNAMRALHSATDPKLTDGEKRASLTSEFSLHNGRRVVLSAINLLGAPIAAYHRQVLFPNAERTIASRISGLSTIISRVVVTIEPLHHFLLSLNSPTVHRRVADASWEALYELSWSGLVAAISEAFPSSRVWVATPDAAFVGASGVLSELFGAAGPRIDPALLQRPLLTSDGQAALAKLRADQQATPDRLEALFATHRNAPDPATLESRIGVDRLTATLLDQRFLEDLQVVEALPNVRLL